MARKRLKLDTRPSWAVVNYLNNFVGGVTASTQEEAKELAKALPNAHERDRVMTPSDWGRIQRGEALKGEGFNTYGGLHGGEGIDD